MPILDTVLSETSDGSMVETRFVWTSLEDCTFESNYDIIRVMQIEYKSYTIRKVIFVGTGEILFRADIYVVGPSASMPHVVDDFQLDWHIGYFQNESDAMLACERFEFGEYYESLMSIPREGSGDYIDYSLVVPSSDSPELVWRELSRPGNSTSYIGMLVTSAREERSYLYIVSSRGRGRSYSTLLIEDDDSESYPVSFYGNPDPYNSRRWRTVEELDRADNVLSAKRRCEDHAIDMILNHRAMYQSGARDEDGNPVPMRPPTENNTIQKRQLQRMIPGDWVDGYSTMRFELRNMVYRIVPLRSPNVVDLEHPEFYQLRLVADRIAEERHFFRFLDGLSKFFHTKTEAKLFCAIHWSIHRLDQLRPNDTIVIDKWINPDEEDLELMQSRQVAADLLSISEAIDYHQDHTRSLPIPDDRVARYRSLVADALTSARNLRDSFAQEER